MSYSTYFDCEIELDRLLEPHHQAYLDAFVETARLVRDPLTLASVPDPRREAVGLPIGKEGCFFVGDEHTGVLGHRPPSGQPSRYCDWRFSSLDETSIIICDEAGGNTYIEWLVYLIETFCKPWGYVVNGSATWEGDDPTDFGEISVSNNTVYKSTGERMYGPMEKVSL